MIVINDFIHRIFKFNFSSRQPILLPRSVSEQFPGFPIRKNNYFNNNITFYDLGERCKNRSRVVANLIGFGATISMLRERNPQSYCQVCLDYISYYIKIIFFTIVKIRVTS